eukprot:scaffold118735_cov29-Tisochrysis_lutea.AAC.3
MNNKEAADAHHTNERIVAHEGAEQFNAHKVCVATDAGKGHTEEADDGRCDRRESDRAMFWAAAAVDEYDGNDTAEDHESKPDELHVGLCQLGEGLARRALDGVWWPG